MKVSIIGAGGWGTALACILNENLHKVQIWAFEKSVTDEINILHTNNIFLPGIKLPENIKAVNDIAQLDEPDLYFFAIPTQFIRAILVNNILNFKNKIVVNVAKGIEKSTLMRISEIFTDVVVLPAKQYVVVTGPSHAEEVVRKTPTTVVAASKDYANAALVQELLFTENFRLYTSNDVVGCEIGGALKNIIAIAAGIIDGLGLGDNTKAALITRGLAELSRIGIALGANPLTFSGLSGLGDLFVTCNSRHSRNRFVGEQIGKGKMLEEITKDMQMVAEGIHTTQSAYLLAQKNDVEAPIIEQMYKILFEGFNPLEAIKSLMTRQSKQEWWW